MSVEIPPNAPWLKFAYEELERGVREITGDGNNPRIVEYHACTSFGARDDETPWCSSFVNWCMVQAQRSHTNNAAALSWLHWGRPAPLPTVGAVTVLWRDNPGSGKGHVAFYVGEHKTNPHYVLLLGGNQGDSVCVAAYEKQRILGFRVPE